MIAERQELDGWGTKVIPRLAVDLKNELPEQKGFSERNIKRMLRFYKEYPSLPLPAEPEVPQPAAQLQKLTKSSVFAAVLGIPWFHNVVLIEKIKDRIIAEYSLRDVEKPIGVADYELTRALPEKLASSLPSIEDLEAELSQELKGEGEE